MATPQEQQTPQPPQEPKDEKLEFLKREEVRTMAKDMAKVRERQAGEERERIARIKERPPVLKRPEQKPPAPQVPARPSEQKPPPLSQAPTRSPKPKRPLTPFEKAFIRVLAAGIILFVLLNILAFSYWYFFISQQP